MTAQEAREGAERKLKDPLEVILKEIEVTVNQGKFELFYYQNMNDILRKELENKGFKVGDSYFGRNVFVTKISW